jgi:hypothetical protein
VTRLAVGDEQMIARYDQGWLEVVGNCLLMMRFDPKFEGCRKLGRGSFEWSMNRDRWSNIEGFLEPFCRLDAEGFPWLVKNVDLSVVITTDGKW